MNLAGRNWRPPTVVVGAGAAGGLGLVAVGAPGGAFIGALAAATAASIALKADVRFPRWVKLVMRAVIGTSLGVSLAALPQSLLLRWGGVAIAYAATVISASALVGVLFAKRYGLPLTTGLVGTAPGGMTEMAAIADEYGLDIDAVVALQFVRKVLAVLTIIPILLIFSA